MNGLLVHCECPGGQTQNTDFWKSEMVSSSPLSPNTHPSNPAPQKFWIQRHTSTQCGGKEQAGEELQQGSFADDHITHGILLPSLANHPSFRSVDLEVLHSARTSALRISTTCMPAHQSSSLLFHSQPSARHLTSINSFLISCPWWGMFTPWKCTLPYL